MKRWDKIIIVLLLVASFLPYLLFKIILTGNADSVCAYLTVDGKLYKKILLTGQMQAKEYIIHTQNGTNTVVVENEGIRVKDSDCTDHICEKFGVADRPGEVIVCLPHLLYIEVKGKAATEAEDTEDARTY